MGRKGKWLVAVKKVFSPESKEKKGQKKSKSKKRWGFGRCNNFESDSSDEAAGNNSLPPVFLKRNSLPTVPQEKVKVARGENDQSKHAHSVALASAVAAEAAAVATQAAAEVIRLTKSERFSGWSKEDVAAIKIQTAFRGFLARRALQALRGLVRLKTLTNSNAVKHQAAAALRCMQMLARVQAQIRSRRIRMSEENQALQRQLQLKHERELEKLRMAEEWDDSLQSKEQIEAHLQNKQEAATRRERALAYAFSHQWKSSSRSANPAFMDPHNLQWGWSWLERWMAARPWENRNTAVRDLNSDRGSVKSVSRSVTGGEIAKAYARRGTNPLSKSGHPGIRHSPSTPPSKAPSMAGKIKSASPRSGWGHTEDDSNSIFSIQSERPRRHSIAASSVRDDESLASATSVPSYMAPTEAAKAKSRYQNLSSCKIDMSSERGSVSSARRRLSFPVMAAPSVPAARRHSGPPKVDVAPLTSAGGNK